MRAIALDLREYIVKPPEEDMEGANTAKRRIAEEKAKLDEFLGLCQSAGYEVVNFIEQRERPHSKLGGLGRGKLDQLIEAVELHQPDALVVNRQFSTSVVNQLEDILHVPVIDRVQLILQIFGRRAQNEEARLQVELAQLNYELPRLRRQVRNALLDEKVGFMAGGEHFVNVYLQNARRRERQIQQRLNQIRTERQTRRKLRLNNETVALAGYTTSGKSTLLNQLTNANVMVANEASTLNHGGVVEKIGDPGLFTTLTTTTRRLELKPPNAVGGCRPITFTDTVGFIDALPPFLLEPFQSTLEETLLANLVIVLLDASEAEDVLLRKLDICLNTLTQINHDNMPLTTLFALNKVDLVTHEQRLHHLEGILSHTGETSPKMIDLLMDPRGVIPTKTAENLLPVVPISAKYDYNLGLLLHQIYLRLPTQRVKAVIPLSPQVHQLLNKLYTKCVLLERTFTETQIDLTFEGAPSEVTLFLNMIERAHGKSVLLNDAMFPQSACSESK